MTDKQNFATKSDFRRLEKKVSWSAKTIEKFHREILAFKWEVDQKLQAYQERTEGLITKFKDEIIGHIDPVMKELAIMREEQAITSHQVSEHGEKLENHEKRIAHLEAPL